MNIPRFPWGAFPDVLILAPEGDVRSHPSYNEAKSGNGDSAGNLVRAFVHDDHLEPLRHLGRDGPVILVSAHAEEELGRNAIPQALAAQLGQWLNWGVDDSVVQSNIVNHTKANGFSRLARPALFVGDVLEGTNCILVDDFVGQGGTLANLRGFLMSKGPQVVGAVVLTGKQHSAKLSPSNERVGALRAKHGEIETEWQNAFGYGFDCLTESEARYLEQTPDAQRIRDRIFTAAQI